MSAAGLGIGMVVGAVLLYCLCSVVPLVAFLIYYMHVTDKKSEHNKKMTKNERVHSVHAWIGGPGVPIWNFYIET